jgi:hypothetical protein
MAFQSKQLLAIRTQIFWHRLGLEFTRLFESVYYLGPLREYPKRQYRWAGEASRCRFKGELTVLTR